MADEQDLSTGTDLPPRWVLASPGDTPLAGRAIGWSELLGDLDRLVEARRAAGESYELVEVAGADAAAFPVSGEGPRYWESLHPADSYLGSISDHVEVYRRGGELLVVDDSGPGSPELVGSLPDGLGPRPEDPDDAGVDEDDPRWLEMSNVDLAWLRAVESSRLAAALDTMGAVTGWHFVSELGSGGFDPHGDVSLLVWIADAAGRLAEASPEPVDRTERLAGLSEHRGFGSTVRWMEQISG